MGDAFCSLFFDEIRIRKELMKKIILFLLVLAVGAIVAGCIFLITWDIPAPREEVTKTIPNELLIN